MRVLVLGGTGFLGAAVVAAALERGDAVTTFNRGRRDVAPTGARAVAGDRTDATTLTPLADGEWDLVVDTWSGAARAVATSASLLADQAARYVYVSSRSVYAWPISPGADETAPVVDADPDADVTDYAADKRGGELAALRAFGADRVLLARAGLILGPREDVGRLPWWLRRVARGGRVLAPGPADLPLQYVDARDLAAFLLASSVTGAVNSVSPPGQTTMGGLLDACLTATGADAELVWVTSEFLTQQGVQGWTELPIWVPADDELIGMHTGDTSRAVEAGLTCRPVGHTVADTWSWLHGGDWSPRADRDPPGLDPDRERALLVAWGAGTA